MQYQSNWSYIQKNRSLDEQETGSHIPEGIRLIRNHIVSPEGTALQQETFFLRLLFLYPKSYAWSADFSMLFLVRGLV